MDNARVLIFVESRYKINRKKIKSAVEGTLRDNEITSPVEVSIAIVGDRKMRQISKKYKNEDKTHNVLSFSQTEGGLAPKSDILKLGDIVISYPQVIKEASNEEKFVDDKVNELVSHGLEHLLGMHHE